MEPSTAELRAFITDNFLFGDASDAFAFSDDDSFQERGIVDSTGVLELVCHLQERYAITIDDDELIPDNLDSLSKVARFVDRKRRETVRGRRQCGVDDLLVRVGGSRSGAHRDRLPARQRWSCRPD